MHVESMLHPILNPLCLILPVSRPNCDVRDEVGIVYGPLLWLPLPPILAAGSENRERTRSRPEPTREEVRGLVAVLHNSSMTERVGEAIKVSSHSQSTSTPSNVAVY